MNPSGVIVSTDDVVFNGLPLLLEFLRQVVRLFQYVEHMLQQRFSRYVRLSSEVTYRLGNVRLQHFYPE